VPLKFFAQAGSSRLFAPFCPLAFSLSAYQSEGWLVGAVGIENNTDWNSKDLEEMLRSDKSLKRNNGESSGILIGPSMAPRFFFASMKFLRDGFSPTALDTESASGPNLAARTASRLINLELSLRQCRTQDVLIRTAPRAAACESSVNHDGGHAADAVLLRL
jgi:hypothetical protein